MAITKISPDLVDFDSALVVSPTLTIGDATAEDTKIVFDGNAQDYYIGLDDSADDLVIGLGSVVGGSPAISIDENLDVAIPSGGLTITTADNTAQLALVSTDADANSGPVLQLYRNSASPADSDVGGQIEFHAENDADEKITYATIRIKTADVSDGTEDGTLAIQTITAGSNRNRFNIQAAETVINEDSRDLDFRVESNGNANMLFVDGGNDKVLIGSTAARSQASVTPAFQIEGTDFNSSSLGLVSNSNGSTGAFIVISHNRGTSVGSSTAVNNGDRIGGIWFQAGDGTDIESTVAYMEANIYGDVGSNDTPGLLKFGTTADGSASPTERLAILPSGGITFNGDRSTANALDDYEEGTFTPTLYGYNGNTISVGGTFNGFYTKIGRLVNIILYAETVTFNSGVSSNYIQISMPFSAHGGSNMLTNAYGAGSFTSHNMDFAHEHSAPSFLTTTTMGFLGSNQDGGGWAWEDWSTVGTNAYWRISMTYMTA